MLSEADKRTIVQKLELIDYLYQRHGQAILDDVGRLESGRMHAIWVDIKSGANGPEDLLNVLWRDMGGEMGMAWTERRDEAGWLRLRCTSCPFADLARAHGYAAAGYALFCAGDHGIVSGFNPELEFSRSTTLMAGDDCCDHAYRLRGG
ncbi:MAG: hypothetical protein A2087_08280 [Spirochaetes bacterium GWD1_61_31]|nr:MAG: hypothetical protein A2Y37_13800 [Spirochaetes bacterium GWB1_60_80]OHD32673.1 MAG: hypothetical protein A2004_02355 [Spirochaetes bacterium GWC1_61_12]OHD42085.1 MAG: hypothetical protein A2Y35_07485 [Spirochaetes bacterium GWE1_60_18]OHD42461.1 MAG: hypothetical protein A2087_08280 [Spirochaetes bacterium GWD1_61_31]OHD60981.1 MAG: hypothetical protein A2Y32_03425 [Spirochaetes bacterium GWF1_60_12]HAP42787.1 hypothetical protein [Spirochaetaceae bacterium]